MPENGVHGKLDQKLDKLLEELEKMRLIMASLPTFPEKLIIENLSVGQIDFHLDNIDINEVSGALNIGITHGVTLSRKNDGVGQTIKKLNTARPQGKNESPAGGYRSPNCKIHFD